MNLQNMGVTVREVTIIKTVALYAAETHEVLHTESYSPKGLGE